MGLLHKIFLALGILFFIIGFLGSILFGAVWASYGFAWSIPSGPGGPCIGCPMGVDPVPVDVMTPIIGFFTSLGIMVFGVFMMFVWVRSE